MLIRKLDIDRLENVSSGHKSKSQIEDLKLGPRESFSVECKTLQKIKENQRRDVPKVSFLIGLINPCIKLKLSGKAK